MKILAAFLCLISFNVYAKQCEEISSAFKGKWIYGEASEMHSIEFEEGSKFLVLDGVKKEMYVCMYYPDINVISYNLKNERKVFGLKKTSSGSVDQNIQLTVNLDKFDLLPDVNSENPESELGAFEWQSQITMDGHIFPSLILSTARWSDDAKKLLGNDKKYSNDKYEILGDPLGVAVLAINNVKPDTRVKVDVDIGNIANISTYETVLKENKIYAIKPKIDYDFQQLLAMKQPIPVNVKFTLYVDGEKIGEKFNTATIRSINDAPTASINKAGGVIDDISWVFAAYVNENNPNIDTLLREAINTGEINRFAGYQAGTEEVYKQVYSIWNALQRRGVKYSSISTPTAVSNKIFSQYVRFFDDTLNTSQANCVDGTVLFASILRRIGINPKIILIPGHAFLGFDLDSNGRQVGYLETTMIGDTDLGEMKQGKSFDEKLSKVLGVKSRKNQKSYNSFVQALNVGSSQALKARAELQANKNPNYKIIDVKLAREIGISPINH